MAHAISFLNLYPVAFLQTLAEGTWHGLDTRVDEPCFALLNGLSQRKEEIVTTSGLSMRQKAQVMSANFNGDTQDIVTGVVGGNYTTQDFDTIKRRIQRLQEVGIAQEAAYALDNFGELMFTFKVGEFSIFGADKHTAYMSMVARYNYRGPDEFFASVIRAICKNTQMWARADAKKRGSAFSFRHSRNINELAEVATNKLLGLDSELSAAYKSVVQQMNEAETMFTTWAQTRVTEQHQDAFVKALFGGDSTQAKNAQDKLNESIGVADQAYDLFNGLTLFTKTGLNVRLADSENAPQGAQLAAKFGAELFDKGDDLRTTATDWINTNLFNAVGVAIA